MADSEDSVPAPPPGFEDVPAGTNELPPEVDPSEVDKVADELDKAKVSGE